MYTIHLKSESCNGGIPFCVPVMNAKIHDKKEDLQTITFTYRDDSNLSEMLRVFHAGIFEVTVSSSDTEMTLSSCILDHRYTTIGNLHGFATITELRPNRLIS